MKDLRSFLTQLAEAMPDAIRVYDEPVDPRFGVTAVAARLARRNEYPAVVCTRVGGTGIPVVVDLTATYERLALALGTTPQQMVRVYAERQAHPVAPVHVERDQAPVKEVVWTGEEADLGRLPIPTHNGLDAGPYVTGGVLICRDPDSGLINAGLYRHQVQGPRQLGVWFWDAHHGGYIHRRHEELGREMPVAIAVGHHPAFVMGAVSRLPGFGHELEEAGALLQEPVRLVQGETVDLPVPADAEIVVEGVIRPGERAFEGPFAEWPGHYIAEGSKPFIRVTAITLRRDAIYYDVFAANREHTVLGSLPRMGSILRRVREVVPGVRMVNVPAHSRMHCYISIRKEREIEVKRAAFAALNTEPENLKLIVVVDDDIDVFNDGEVLWAIGTRFDASREGDLLVIPGWSGPGGLLPAGWTFDAEGGKQPRRIGAMVIDATRPAPPVRYPERAVVPADAVDLVDPEALRPFEGLASLRPPALAWPAAQADGRRMA
jgi:2,5-furandicarboxylate decarboxylase 1